MANQQTADQKPGYNLLVSMLKAYLPSTEERKGEKGGERITVNYQWAKARNSSVFNPPSPVSSDFRGLMDLWKR